MKCTLVHQSLSLSRSDMLMETIMKMRFPFPGRSVSLPLAIRSWLLFRCWKTKRLGKKKWTHLTRLKKTVDGTHQNSLDYLHFHLPWPPAWLARREMHQENEITGDYSVCQKKNNVCSRCSQVLHFPLTLKRVQVLSFDKTGMPTSLLDFFE